MRSSSVITKDYNAASVPAYLFLPQGDYTAEKILCWGVCKKHLEIARDSNRLKVDRAIHGIIAIIECLPLIGQLASLVEAIASKIFGGCWGLGPRPEILDPKTVQNRLDRETVQNRLDRETVQNRLDRETVQNRLDRANELFNIGYEFFETLDENSKKDIREENIKKHRLMMKEAYEEAQKIGADLKFWDETLAAIDAYALHIMGSAIKM